MRVLFADSLVDRARLRLASAGFEVFVEPTLTAGDLAAAVERLQVQVLVVRSTEVREEVVRAGSLALVVRAGAGVNTIDLQAASARGVLVANCPGRNADAVAELTLGLLLAIDRQIPQADAVLKQGQWDKARFKNARGLRGRVFGVLGCGSIGTEVIRRAQGFGMTVVAWSRSLSEERALALGVRRLPWPEEVAKRADVLSVHLALTDATRGFVGRSIFEVMKNPSIFLNTSRAEVVNEEALLEALDRGQLRAGLDVFSDEPGLSGPFQHSLAQHPEVVGSHHIGASTQQAQEAVAEEAVRIIEVFRDTGRAENCVNLAELPRSEHVISVRHLDRVGVLAAVLGVLQRAGLNVREMENTVFMDGGAASARVGLSDRPSPHTIEQIVALPAVLHVSVSKKRSEDV